MKKLYQHQKTALSSLKNGCILVGGTGSGKTLVGLYYYYERILGGSTDPLTAPANAVDLFVLTTARKRDERDWQEEILRLGISDKEGVGHPEIKFKVDSWNNIKKYLKVRNSFFIFDEQKSTGRGVWARSMVRIAKKNKWIMLSATPADRWTDLVPVFIANGFYRSRREFEREHVVFQPYIKYPKILRYTNEAKLRRLRDHVYVVMPFEKKTNSIIEDVKVAHDQEAIDEVVKNQWNTFTERPITNQAEHNFVVRRLVNQDPDRIKKLKKIYTKHKKIIVFYNFNFELEAIKKAFVGDVVAEYNGDKHQPVPEGDEWLYLVQYMSGNEAWECFTTNRMVFYSLNYSYRIMIQAMGRINRLNTPYQDLYYYRFVSDSSVDRAILKAFRKKKNFNDSALRFI